MQPLLRPRYRGYFPPIVTDQDYIAENLILTNSPVADRLYLVWFANIYNRDSIKYERGHTNASGILNEALTWRYMIKGPYMRAFDNDEHLQQIIVVTSPYNEFLNEYYPIWLEFYISDHIDLIIYYNKDELTELINKHIPTAQNPEYGSILFHTDRYYHDKAHKLTIYNFSFTDAFYLENFLLDAFRYDRDIHKIIKFIYKIIGVEMTKMEIFKYLFHGDDLYNKFSEEEIKQIADDNAILYLKRNLDLIIDLYNEEDNIQYFYVLHTVINYLIDNDIISRLDNSQILYYIVANIILKPKEGEVAKLDNQQKEMVMRYLHYAGDYSIAKDLLNQLYAEFIKLPAGTKLSFELTPTFDTIINLGKIIRSCMEHQK